MRKRGKLTRQTQSLHYFTQVRLEGTRTNVAFEEAVTLTQLKANVFRSIFQSGSARAVGPGLQYRKLFRRQASRVRHGAVR